MNQLTKNVKTDRTLNSVAAGTSDTYSSAVTLGKYNGVRHIALLGTIASTGVATIKAQHGDVSDLSDAADISGASVSVTDTDGNKAVIVEVSQPTKPYHRLYIDRGTANSVIDGVITELFVANKAPASQGSNVLTPAVV